MLLILVMGVSALVEILGASPSIESQSRHQVLNYEMETSNMPNSYKFHYNSSDGTSRTEQGSMQQNGSGVAALSVHGAVRWYNDKGHLYEMTYKAGRRGYRTIIKKIS
ncbi:unnamed protein product, partial [Brenthis ino]